MVVSSIAPFVAMAMLGTVAKLGNTPQGESQMMFSTVVALFFLFLAFVITALEPRLTARSARLSLLRATDAVVPINAVPAGVDCYGARVD
jgi:DMSO/TMAO reductase YedYZ heme-binding membrane subunit